MKNMCKLTVVTVVKNDAIHLEETILNVIEKRLIADIDFVVIDGGSTDGTLEVIKKFADHISYWSSEHDSGIYEAMNKGWAVAEVNSFILFLGAGDRLVSLPNDMGSFSANTVIYGSVQMGENTVFQPRADFHLKLYNSLHHQALMINKSLHISPPFDCRYHLYADFDFNQRLKKNKTIFTYSPDFVGYARTGGVSERKCFRESLKVVTRNFGYIWAMLAILGYLSMRLFPLLKRFQPIREI